MAFSTFCNNKGCFQLQEPYLDPQTNKVYCSACDQELPNITQFAKAQMKSNKQFRQKQAKAFSTKCPKCQKEERPKLVNNEIVCGFCSKPLDHLTPIYKNMLREQLQLLDKD